MRIVRRSALCGALLCATLLASCGGGDAAGPSPSSGQVSGAAAAGAVTQYAASRFAEQASFGPTPALVAEIRQKGFAKWIDDQFALPASQADPAPYLSFIDPTPAADWTRYHHVFSGMALTAPDQLRLRTTWALSQFIVVSDRKIDLVGALYWLNLLQTDGLGKYDTLLYNVSVSPAMGTYLDNNQNRPKSAECPHCAPNENFARELMQLFSLGVIKLQPDGTPVRDAANRFVETYTQRDVEELARVLTGWQFNPTPASRPNRNYGNWAKPMVPSTWPPERDAGAKTVLGRSFPAGQSTVKDLQDAIDLLMNHGNIAPFVALRMIQHLVKSNPSPAYLGRVAAKFRNNGAGVKGDMKAVVKAVLLDPEARAGDIPTLVAPGDGKFREPFLHATALLRGLGCTRFTEWNGGGVNLPQAQRPFGAESVFSFYAPTDRAPGSNLLAPEQRLLTSSELVSRLNGASGTLYQPNGPESLARLNGAGCNVEPLIQSWAASPAQYTSLLGQLYFRGVMPPLLRNDIESMIRQPSWDTSVPFTGPLVMLDFALATPYFGVMK
jgi:uncharacterized protein (DUF1800 family)